MRHHSPGLDARGVKHARCELLMLLNVMLSVTGLTEDELEEERLREMEKLMKIEAEKREEQERIASEQALLKARRQEEWVGASVS